MSRTKVALDGNEAAAHIAYLASEVIAIYPITPASPMGELSDVWASQGRPNAWGTVPQVVEMQSEGGAAGAVHGALQAGSLTTTFTASQGLLLMIPNMYKIAGELTAAVFHIAARSIATHALSIFGDHSDVMAARQCGWAMLASGSVQEAMDLALVAHAATLEARVPFLHFFDGFRTSHEIATVDRLDADDVRAVLDADAIADHRARGMTPDAPVLRGTAQNPDVFFQAREACNPYYRATPAIVQDAMDRVAARTGRPYHLFDYVGAQDADRVIVMMGSGCGAAEEAVEALCAAGERVGLVKVRLYRPWSPEHLLAAIPATARTIAVLDRTKEPGAPGEPLYLDVLAAVADELGSDSPHFARPPRVVGGRYGLSSKEFTPAMVQGVFEHLAAARPRHDFTVGIVDDVTHTGLPWNPEFTTEPAETVRAVFFGLGSDGTVGANKSSIKIIGEQTPLQAQGYFVYDSKKAGSTTVSHLRFGPQPIRSTYLIRAASFVACHQFDLLTTVDVLGKAARGATFLLNSPFGPDEVWDHLPAPVQAAILEKELAFWVVDAGRVARDVGMGRRINVVMQTCFFALSKVLPREEAIAAIRASVVKSYGKRGEAVVKQNQAAIDNALDHLHQVAVPLAVSSTVGLAAPVSSRAPAFVRDVLGEIIAGRGDELPVSAMPVDGTFPTGTAQWEKRNIAEEIPVWDPDICIQCGKCVLVCPHSVIRGKVVNAEALQIAPETMKSAPARWKGHAEERYVLQVAPEDCTGCRLCVEVCPVKNKSEVRLKAINMAPQRPLREAEAANWEFFLGMDQTSAAAPGLHPGVKEIQLADPYFEFSGACAGCGETPYLKLMTQLYGDRAIVANATGCSSIYGGNLPTTPWSVDANGRGPAWSNSLFEDNAEFGLGMRVAVDKQREYAADLLMRHAAALGPDLVAAILSADQEHQAGVEAQRERVAEVLAKARLLDLPEIADFAAVAPALVDRKVWIIGGDGWAYDIGYGGLDHVLASGRDVNVLVLDTEVYSNTGGQMSKATPRAAVAKFAAGGKPAPKKDLALMAIAYGTIYVARVAMGGSDRQVIKALQEAASYPGPSLVIAYSHCIAHGYDLAKGMEQQKNAVDSGHWPLFRYDPRRAETGENPMQLDSKAPRLALEKYIYNETRYTMLARAKPEEAKALLELAKGDVAARWKTYAHLAEGGKLDDGGAA